MTEQVKIDQLKTTVDVLIDFVILIAQNDKFEGDLNWVVSRLSNIQKDLNND